MHLYRLGVTAPTERIAIYGGKIPRTPSNLGFIQMKITEDLKRTYDPG